MGIWNSHTSVGNILGSLIAGVWVNGQWGLSFVVPGAITAIMGLFTFLFLIECEWAGGASGRSWRRVNRGAYFLMCGQEAALCVAPGSCSMVAGLRGEGALAHGEVPDTSLSFRPRGCGLQPSPASCEHKPLHTHPNPLMLIVASPVLLPLPLGVGWGCQDTAHSHGVPLSGRPRGQSRLCRGVQGGQPGGSKQKLQGHKHTACGHQLLRGTLHPGEGCSRDQGGMGMVRVGGASQGEGRHEGAG